MLSIKPNHKTIKEYYLALETFSRIGITHETAVRNAFQSLLVTCCRQMHWNFIEEFHFKRAGRNPASVDGAMLDRFNVVQGYWEAKDTQDDLAKEISKKFTEGYPRDNIIFQQPERAILWQGNTQICDVDITNANLLVQVLKELFSYKTDIQTDWEVAVEEFKNRIPESAGLVINLIEQERKVNKRFIDTFNTFADLCRASINPNLADPAIEEMLVQHLLTERIFSKVFENSDFVNRNIIASEIEKVIQALTSRSFSRHEFLKSLDRFYVSLEKRALAIDDFSQKQAFLNTVYEKFFQGFAVKVADTHGIVYTPQPIVEFMVDSVEEILKCEFGKSLSSPNVHILDPFTGTGSFVVHTLHKINKTDLKNKFMNELHCNEIMLLPYYIATMNIEHEYYSLTGDYEPFPGICLVDTFQLAEEVQASMFSEENTQRVQKLKETPIFVFISNPPYNAGQVNENDNNKNRKYPVIDKRVSDTYAKDSKATNKNMLQDPYIKAFRWASDNIIKNGEGIVAFISNNSFIDGIALDGMRKHLNENFDRIYIIDLKGNIRKDSMKDGIPLGEKHTVFGLGAMVGISIAFLIKNPKITEPKILISEVDFRETRIEKFKFLEKKGQVYNIDWKEIIPDKNNNWLNEGMQDDWDEYNSIGSKEAKAGEINSIFKLYSRGVVTCRDAWVFNFGKNVLEINIKKMIEAYNENVIKYHLQSPKPKVNEFINYDESEISWSESLKFNLLRNKIFKFDISSIRKSIYRPFVASNLYFDKYLTERRYQYHHIFPTLDSEKENLSICVSGIGHDKQFYCLITNQIPELFIVEKSQCFPFYAYNEDGTGKKENITDWALQEFQKRYSGLGTGDSGKEYNLCEINKGNENGQNQIVQGFESVAGSDGSNNGDLYNNQTVSEGGNVRVDKPDEESSRFDSIQHSRGAHPQIQKGIPLSSVGSDRVTVGIGNSIDDSSKSTISEHSDAETNIGENGKIGSNARSFNKLTEPLNPQPPAPNPKTQTPITKWDIFYYIYAVLHKPEYRTKYAANLRRELPRIPYYDDFWKYSESGKKLAELHVNYESQPEYPLTKIEAPGKQLDYKIVKMKLSKDKQTLIYNDFLSLTGIPYEAFEYKLGNRSALEWLIDQYQIKTDKRSGIVNDPNRPDEPDYILKLIGKIITVSLETVKIVREL
ncbi:MAG: hypothetical protein A2X61_05165 [Ignavibacteria bacterium GWB2_35_12]|nr:MAG: hypothetical protein A2X63_01420 [Ignavibacteria bacterium GWA2_35_8]OGU42335.1 MAG: hypothetical protein A2X61_05165 [Ignavibacteria bacterium GWB2_35_12]OGU96961.1 MAG: hypothetical protein A2220_10000 [Ignavibacteria bacterium RIFOXYA2_FULL_35_10]OGV18563.1 MAG: hypothetical protein A2475_01855 [Ignavibacteria bacterium RIFOXYC2_FULL_35_21]